MSRSASTSQTPPTSRVTLRTPSLLGYYTDDGRLHYAGRAGTGFNEKELARLAGVLRPLQVARMPLAAPPPRETASARRSNCHAFTGSGRRLSWR
ncbi:MAG: hypothetical protein JO339_08050 [Alphaproteobacteria bacterium]|nr:hypothetical protein [Alphaproteobacteria bacterium]